MNTVFHPASQRGQAHHGWLKSMHSFSFADFFDPEKTGFGQLRVLNDDQVEPGKGFDPHPHRDMEIISIPLAGSLAHKDSEGHSSVIQSGDVQIMSAGHGILHSEYNASASEPVHFLQIWIHTRTKGIPPRYDQKSYQKHLQDNQWQVIVSPSGGETAVKIEQDAYLSVVKMSAESAIRYQTYNAKHGVYFFILDGEVTIEGKNLGIGDALGVWDMASINLNSQNSSQVLAIEVPMGAA
ncbi:MAG: pirin family protein [Oligoflexus sp.]